MTEIEYNQCVRDYADNVFRFILKNLRHEEDARDVVQSAFEKHIAEHRYGGDQISFLRAVRSVFLSKRTLQAADLYEPPLTQFGRNAADRLFRPDEIEQLIALTDQLAA